MKTNTTHALQLFPLPITKHAMSRMNQRRLSEEAIMMVIAYGRLVRVRGAEIFAVGKKEVERYLADGIDLSKFKGVQVVCNSDGSIITVYRNNDFHGLRPRSGDRLNRWLAA